MRNLVWFSCGAASTIAAKIAVQKYKDVEVLYCYAGGEMDDNIRYLKDVEKWLDFPIHTLRNKRYDTHWEVIEDTGYLVSEYGAIRLVATPPPGKRLASATIMFDTRSGRNIATIIPTVPPILWPMIVQPFTPSLSKTAAMVLA